MNSIINITKASTIRYSKNIIYISNIRKFTTSSNNNIPPIFNNTELKERLLKHPKLINELNILISNIEKAGLFDRNNPSKQPNMTALLMNPGIMKDMVNMKKTFEECGFSPYELQNFMMSMKSQQQNNTNNTTNASNVAEPASISEKKEPAGIFDKLKGLFKK